VIVHSALDITTLPPQTLPRQSYTWSWVSLFVWTKNKRRRFLCCYNLAEQMKTSNEGQITNVEQTGKLNWW